ncbi:alanine racemase domain protein [Fibrella aestuarina BUZ 2]|uniref:Alanine racemase domain protein n=1 Tax=Fibrella aestuarina BUZ 2 TaxID=1166018 RepID=I0KDF2_9BACT|nr:D-TA family PLP-dependent enzyme [Fibrella aestuarina]CCH02155.1 alanine racemase domain protein [Fibrella aestuarina BUZ 2]
MTRLFTAPPTAPLDQLDSPALLVYPDTIDANIDAVLALTATPTGNCLRAHIKTVKCQEIAALAIQKGIRKFKCSTIAEAELLGRAGAPDVLLNMQLSAVKAQRFAQVRRAFGQTTFASLIDNVPSAQLLSDLFADAPLNVYIDVNVGMDRTGIAPANVPTLIEAVKDMPGIRVVGLHGYDGHLRDTDPAARQAKTDAIYAQMQPLQELAAEQFGRTITLVMGGSPSFRFYAGKPDVECSPGTFFLWDAGYGSSFPDLPFQSAAFILTRILSIVDEQTLCFDLGSKAVAADPPLPRVVFPQLDEYEVVRQSEEHLNVRVPDSAVYQVGQAFLAIPMHVCPTVNLYERVIPVVDGRPGEPWRIVARDRMITM